jgi:hypothetical protein
MAPAHSITRESVRPSCSAPVVPAAPVADLHAAPRHAAGRPARRRPDAGPLAASMAAADEVLEDESASRSNELVGPHGLARRRVSPLGVAVAEAEWARVYLAAFHVCQRASGVADGQTGEVVSRPAAVHQDATRAAGHDQADSAAVHSTRHRRLARRLGRFSFKRALWRAPVPGRRTA